MTAEHSSTTSSQAGGVRRKAMRTNKRRASTNASDNHDEEDDEEEGDENESPRGERAAVKAGVGSVSHLMLERLRETHALHSSAAAAHQQQQQQQQQPVMEMLRLQTQISDLVDQLRNITIQVSGMSPTVGSPMPPAACKSSPAPHATAQQPPPPLPAQPSAAAKPNDNNTQEPCNELHIG
ncbi:hypothetical protein IWW38_002612, partial [Coemansia aciculifera]